MKYLPSYFAALALACSGSAFATVYVDATGAGGAYTTINAALATADTDIVVKNTGIYEESLLVTRSVTIRGEDPNNRPVIAVHVLPTQPALLGSGFNETDGIYLGGDGASSNNLDITIKNLVFIPTISGTPPSDDCITGTANAGAVLNCIIENVLVAANNGSNQPVSDDVWANPDLSGSTKFTDDGLFFSDEQFGGGLAGTIHVVFRDLTVIGVGGDGLVAVPGDGTSTLSGVKVSYNGRYGAQLTDIDSDHTTTGTRENPGFVARKNGSIGLACIRGDNVNLDHLVLLENGSVGMRCDWDSVNKVNISDSLFANNSGDGFWTQYGAGSTKTWNIKDSTFYNNSTVGIAVQNATNANATLIASDCVFAGSSSYAVGMTGSANVQLVNCGVVTEVGSPDALLGVNSTGSGALTVSSPVNEDPGFVSTSVDPLMATSFDVTDMAYATASSTTGALNGWGDGPGSAVPDWSVY